MLEQILQSLLGAGPVAVILGYSLWTVWDSKKAQEAAFADRLKAKDDAHTAQEEKMRTDFAALLVTERARADAEVKAERDRHENEESELRGELVAALKSVAGAMRSGS